MRRGGEKTNQILSTLLNPRAKQTPALLLALAVTASLSSRGFAQLVATPGAEGYGALTTGGRAGSLYIVTNLNDSGAGSFRDAVSQSGRIVVFAVGGYVNLQSAVSVKSNITILGQTAPGDGIGFMGREISFSSSSNDIMQYVHVRQGSLDPDSGKSGINAGSTTNMFFDHISNEFGQWDNIDAVGAVNMTVQNTLDADPIGQQFNAHVETGPVTFANNVFSSAHNRSPLVKTNTQFVNNVVYNFQAGYTVANTGGVFSQDIVNNYFIVGPSTTSSGDAFFQMDNKITAYSTGNLNDTNQDGVLNGGTVNPSGVVVSATPTLPTTTALPTLTTAAAYAWNIAHAGDSIKHDPTTYAVTSGYDSVDSLVLNDVTSLGASGKLWSSQTSTGLTNSGYGVLNGGFVPASTANDFLPDAWAVSHGLSKTDSGGAMKLNALGYTMIEQYAQEMADVLATKTWSGSSGEWNSGVWAGAKPGIYDHALISGTGAADGSANVSVTGATAFSLAIGGNGPAAGGGEKLNVTAGSLTIYNTLTVGFQNNATVQISGGTVIAGNVQLGNTVFDASGNPTNYTGTLALIGGTLQTQLVVQGVGTPGNWTAGAAWTWAGGALQAGPNGLYVAAPATLSAGGGIIDSNSTTATLAGILSGSGGLTKIGAGTATLTASNTYTGPTTITAGVLAIPALANGGAPSELGASSSAAANFIMNGGTLLGTGVTDRLFTLKANSTLDNSNGMTFTSTGAIALAAGANLTLTLTGASSAHNTLEPALADVGAGFITSVTKSGAGKWDFSNGAKTYSGDTHVTAGTLETLTSNALSPNSNMILDAGAILDFHQTSQTINALSGAGAVNNSFGSGQTFSLGAANGSATFSGAINGALNLTKTGTGTQTLSGSNTYTGNTTISAGTLVIGAGGTSGNFGTGAALIDNAALKSNRSDSVTWTSAITGSGSLTQSGAGTLILSASNAYTGGTTISAGTLQIATSTALSSNTAVVVNAGLLALTPGTSTLLRPSTLTIAGATHNGTINPSAAIDFADNDAIIPGASYSTNEVRQLLFAGYANAAWTGNGIKSSAALPNESIGYLSAANFNTLNPFHTFDGISLAGTETVLKFTYAGDATLDGRITAADYAQLDAGFLLQTANPIWFNGDFNYDGVVNYKDYALIDFAYVHQTAGTLADGVIAAHASEFGAPYETALQDLELAAAPEPGSLALLLAGAFALLRRKASSPGTSELKS